MDMILLLFSLITSADQLIAAVNFDNYPKITELLTHDPTLLDKPIFSHNQAQYRLSEYAVRTENFDLIKFLIQYIHDDYTKGTCGHYAFDGACALGRCTEPSHTFFQKMYQGMKGLYDFYINGVKYVDRYEALLNSILDTEFWDRPSETNAYSCPVHPLFRALRYDFYIFNIVLNHPKVDVNTRYVWGETVLIHIIYHMRAWSFKRSSAVNAIKLLMQKSANPLIKDEKGKTAFDFAREIGSFGEGNIDYLLEVEGEVLELISAPLKTMVAFARIAHEVGIPTELVDHIASGYIPMTTR